MKSVDKRTHTILINQAIMFHKVGSLELAKSVIAQKMVNQHRLLVHASARLDKASRDGIRGLKLAEMVEPVWLAETKAELLLLEARVARQYWKRMAVLIRTKAPFVHRNQHQTPVVKLLNIGYHHLGIVISKSLQKAGLSPSVGFLHGFHHDNQPLVYDVMELFRQPVVDWVLLKFIRQRKIPLLDVDQLDIARLIQQVKLRLDEVVEATASVRDLIDMESLVLRNYILGKTEDYQPCRWKWGHKKRKTHRPSPA